MLMSQRVDAFDEALFSVSMASTHKLLEPPASRDVHFLAAGDAVRPDQRLAKPFPDERLPDCLKPITVLPVQVEA
jgi:hypothetical protein